jgi:hypothetical protein
VSGGHLSIVTFSEEHGVVPRTAHPGRTVVLGALLIVAAMVGATLVWGDGGLPGWLRTALLVLAVPVALTGWVLTFRDLSTPLPRNRRRSR